MHTHTLIGWTLAIAASMTCVFVATEPVSAKSDAEDQKITAVSGKVTGGAPQVGFRALIQKQAIRYNVGEQQRQVCPIYPSRRRRSDQSGFKDHSKRHQKIIQCEC
jgi:hypothetical protein